MNDILIDEDIEINLDENTEANEIKRPFYYKSFKNYISMMIKIKWRTQAYRFSYVSSFFIAFMSASLFASIQTPSNKTPQPIFISSSSFSKILNTKTAFYPNSTEVNELISLIPKTKNNSALIYEDINEMADFIFKNEEVIYGFCIEDNFTNLTVISNDVLKTSFYKYHTIELMTFYKFFPEIEFTIYQREYAKPPETINFETTSSAFYLIFPYFYWMLMSLNADVTFSANRNTFSMLLNGLPESILYIGRTFCYFVEMLPIDFFFIIIMNQFVIQSEKKIDMFYFFVIITIFLLSYSLRFVTYSTFIHSEKTMSYWVTILQIINICELSTLDMFPSYSKLVQLLLLLLIPQYPLLVVYYVFLKQENEEISWSTQVIPGFFSYKELFFIQIFNVVINIFVTFFFVLMNKQSFGMPLIGWRNIFKPRFWRRCFRWKPIRLIFERQELISLRNVKYSYDKTVALDGINLSISPNEVVVFVGPNGSGKSTLIDVLTGAIEQKEGDVSICGFELRDVYYEYHNNLGVVFQTNTLYDKLTAREHFILFSFRIGNDQTVNSEIERLASLLQISDVLESFAENLSGGEKRKLCLALALLQKPHFLILDEPTAGVDAFCRRQIWKVVGDLNNTTSLVSTHSLEESEYISSRFAVLKKGQIAFLGTGAEMRHEFNSGYKITFITNEIINLNGLCELIQKVIPETSISNEKKNTLVVPSDLRVSDALDLIEKHKNEFGVTKYIVQIDNLEESLVKLIEEEEGEIHLNA